MSQFSVNNFLKKEFVDGVYEYDLLTMHWDEFRLNRPSRDMMVTPHDIGRPDALSVRAYGDSQYWWLLMRVNKIDDVWNDLVVGDYLIIPDIRDFDDFYTKLTKLYM